MLRAFTVCLFVLLSVGVCHAAPVAVDDEYVLKANETSYLSPIYNDTSPEGDQNLQIASVTPAQHGTVSLNPEDPYSVVYEPTPGYAGDDSFTYVARDSESRLSNSATVTLHVGNRPYIVYVAQHPSLPERGEAFVVDVEVEAQGAAIVSVTFGGAAMSPQAGIKWSANFVAPASAGTYSADVVATDTLGRSTTYAGTYRVLPTLFTHVSNFQHAIFGTLPGYDNYFKIAGRVVSRQNSQFVLDDGSGPTVTVWLVSHGLQVGEFAVVRGTPIIFGPNDLYFSVEGKSRMQKVQ